MALATPLCSFCGSAAPRLRGVGASGPMVTICADCVVLCHDLLEQEADNADLFAAASPPSPEVTLQCSFCGGAASSRCPVVAAADAAVCARCVAEARRMVAGGVPA